LYTGKEMETKQKKKETAFLLQDKPQRPTTSEKYQFHALNGTNFIIRRRRGQHDKRIYFSKKAAASLQIGDLHHSKG
jgi:hypothetical protein